MSDHNYEVGSVVRFITTDLPDDPYAPINNPDDEQENGSSEEV